MKRNATLAAALGMTLDEPALPAAANETTP
jgi:hypothetical protein